MTPDQVRQIIREELASLLKSDRYVFEKTLQIADGRKVQVGKGTGTMIATEATQKLGFFGATPVVQQPNGTAETVLVALGLMAP